MSRPQAIPTVLSIAGSDSGGGAGIQADLKAFARCRVHGTTAITTVTAQNTLTVASVHPVPPRIVCAQIEAVVSDIGVDAVKVGMLGRAATVRAVARCLRDCLSPDTPIVLDPVLIASTGRALLSGTGLDRLLGDLLPLATVLTPNVAEARTLVARATGATPGSGEGEDEWLVGQLLELGPSSVVLTGGHRAVPGDLYGDAEQLVELGGVHYESQATHGSGCTHSAVLAAELAQGRTPLAAARIAASLAAEAIRDGLDQLGEGAGPVNVLSIEGDRVARPVPDD